MEKYKIFTEVRPYYLEKIKSLEKAKKRISMTYYAFDRGQWAEKIIDILEKKSRQGIKVNLIIDSIGLRLDNLNNFFSNQDFVKKISLKGIEIMKFKGKRSLTTTNAMHCKFCAIDDGVVLMGGSNIGDYYTKWRDSNIKIYDEFGNLFHDLFDYIKKEEYKKEISKKFYKKNILLTIPGKHSEIYDQLLKLIENSKEEIYIRTWYFLPDKRYISALEKKLKQGIKVNIMLSDKTRVPIIDLMNMKNIKKLVQKGAKIYRYKGRYMHSKIYWNEKKAIFGSFNMNKLEINKNFEVSILLNKRDILNELTNNFRKDIKKCIRIIS